MTLWILLLWAFIPLERSFSAESAELTLDQAFQAAFEKNEKIHQSQEQVVQASERISRIQGGLYPELNANVYHLIQPLPTDPIAREFSPAQQTTASLSVTQPLFRGLREFAAMRQQKQTKSVQESLQKQATQQLYQDVAMNFLNVLSLEQDLKNLDEQVGIHERRVNELRGRIRRGESSTTELLASESTQNALQAELRLVGGQLRMARETLHSLTGVSRDVKLVDPQLITAHQKFTGEGLDHYLGRIETRPDIQAALSQRSVSEEGVLMARGTHYPSLDAVGNYYFVRPGFLSDLRWDFSFRLTIPLFAGGAVQAQVREAASRNKEAEFEVSRVRRLAEEEIRSLYESLEARVDRLKYLRQSVVLAEKNVSVSQDEFRRGLIRSIDVQSALNEYRIMRRSLDQAQFTAQMDLIKLEVASGLKPEEVSQEVIR